MDSEKMSHRLLAGWIAIYAVAGAVALFFELSGRKGMVTDPAAIYVLDVIGVAIALGLIPLALRGFRKMCCRLSEKGWPNDRIDRRYYVCAWLRIAAFFIVVVFGVALYYLINDSIGLYIAVIGAICSLFSFPTKAAVDNELGYD